MGIQYLNSYIKKNTGDKSIQKVKLSTLYKRIITVDISIYLYRYLSEGELLENMYHMLSIFYHYKIYPIFVFDGKPPPEKYDILRKRYDEKKLAKIKYKEMEELLLRDTDSKNEILHVMSNLKKQFIKVEHSDILKIKELITAFGYIYIQANCEADIICGKLVKKKIAYACLSEDMDMFLYGCTRVIRYFSLLNHSVVIYNLYNILNDLSMTFKEFKEICILSGTDYSKKRINLYKTIELYKQYKKSEYTEFFDWLDDNTNEFDNIYIYYNIYNMFLTDQVELKEYKINVNTSNCIMNCENKIDTEKIKNIMKPEGFIFV